MNGTIVRSPKLAERRRAVRLAHRRKRRRGLIATLTLVTILAGAWALTRTSVFALSAIEIVGAESISRSAILSATGLRIGQPALSVDAAAVERRVEALPEVDDARVERPDAVTLRIAIVERRAVVLVRAGDRSWYVSADGRPVRAPRTRTAMPVLRLPPTARAVPASLLDDVQRVWRALPDRQRAQVRWFQGRGGEIAFGLGRTEVTLGSVADLGRKLEALGLVLARAEAEGTALRTVDVRSPLRPAARV